MSEARRDREFWGRLVESAIGAHLANAAAAGECGMFYWRGRNAEIDFVVRVGKSVTAIESQESKRPARLSVSLAERAEAPIRGAPPLAGRRTRESASHRCFTAFDQCGTFLDFVQHEERAALPGVAQEQARRFPLRNDPVRAAGGRARQGFAGLASFGAAVPKARQLMVGRRCAYRGLFAPARTALVTR